MQTLNIADQSNVELRKELADKEHACKSVDSALESTQRQAEDQRQESTMLLPRFYDFFSTPFLGHLPMLYITILMLSLPYTCRLDSRSSFNTSQNHQIVAVRLLGHCSSITSTLMRLES